ncbi:hypothetical protein ACUOCP_16185, partial [Escherichia sp. R-CC3]
ARAAILSNEKFRGVRLYVSENQLKIRRFIVACGRVNSTSLCQSSRFGKSAAGRVDSEKREEECRKVILVPGAQSAEAAQKAVSGLVNAMPGGTI